MKYELDMTKKIFPLLLNKHDDSWNYFYNKEFDKSLEKLQQFYLLLHKFKEVLNTSNHLLSVIITSTNILYRNHYFMNHDTDVGFFQLQDNKGIIFYLLDNDINDVYEFYGQLYTNSELNLRVIYNLIDNFIKEYEKSNEIIETTMYLSDTLFSKDKIEFDVYYENEGTIHISLDKHGFFQGDCLFLLNIDEHKDYVDDFYNKIHDIFSYVLSPLKEL